MAVAAVAGSCQELPNQDLRAEKDKNKRYFLIGPKAGAKLPAEGYRLVVILPGGDGSADFNPFVQNILRQALPDRYVVAQPVAPKWPDKQFEKIVWPTKSSPWEGMAFSTEEFVEAVVKDVKGRLKIDPRYVFTLSWSSSGPACYAISLQKEKAITGSFIAMSVFRPNLLPPLENAKGHAYYLLHSPDDFIPLSMAQKAHDTLQEKGAKVQMATYEGGHGWHGDVFGNIRKGIAWLEEKHAEPANP
jgi:predicted esterase